MIDRDVVLTKIAVIEECIGRAIVEEIVETRLDDLRELGRAVIGRFRLGV